MNKRVNDQNTLPQLLINQHLQQRGQVQIQTFQKWILLMQQYRGDTSKYHQEYNNDQQALASAKTDLAYQMALQDLNKHVGSVKLQALKAQANALEHQLSQQSSEWSKQHPYLNRYDNVTYHLGYEYGVDGVGGWLHDEITEAKTLAEYQHAIEDANVFQTSFQAYQFNTHDKTPWNKAHATDNQLIEQYGFSAKKVVVISLGEQACVSTTTAN